MASLFVRIYTSAQVENILKPQLFPFSSSFPGDGLCEHTLMVSIPLALLRLGVKLIHQFCLKNVFFL